MVRIITENDWSKKPEARDRQRRGRGVEQALSHFHRTLCNRYPPFKAATRVLDNQSSPSSTFYYSWKPQKWLPLAARNSSSRILHPRTMMKGASQKVCTNLSVAACSLTSYSCFRPALKTSIPKKKKARTLKASDGNYAAGRANPSGPSNSAEPEKKPTRRAGKLRNLMEMPVDVFANVSYILYRDAMPPECLSEIDLHLPEPPGSPLLLFGHKAASRHHDISRFQARLARLYRRRARAA